MNKTFTTSNRRGKREMCVNTWFMILKSLMNMYHNNCTVFKSPLYLSCFKLLVMVRLRLLICRPYIPQFHGSHCYLLIIWRFAIFADLCLRVLGMFLKKEISALCSCKIFIFSLKGRKKYPLSGLWLWRERARISELESFENSHRWETK